MTPAIENGFNQNTVFIYLIVNSKREPLREKAMVAEYDLMDATIIGKRINVGKQGVKKV